MKILITENQFNVLKESKKEGVVLDEATAELVKSAKAKQVVTKASKVADKSSSTKKYCWTAATSSAPRRTVSLAFSSPIY